MKRCPECRRDYHDDSLLYCLDDGSALVEGPAAADEPPTALLSSSQVKETPTRKASAAWGDSDPVGAQHSGRRLQSRWITILLPIAGLVLVMGGGIAFYKYYHAGTPAAGAFESIKISKLTSNGKVTEAVISPDGKQLVYVVDDAGMRSLWLKQVLIAGSEVQLSPPQQTYYTSLSISPDGQFLFYAEGPVGPNSARSFFQKPLLSGAPRKIVADVSAPIGFSRDGNHMAFVRNQPEPSLVVAQTDGTQERVVASLKPPDGFGNFGKGGVTWSPDGTKIAAIVSKNDADGRYYSVIEVPVEGGTERPLTQDRWDGIERLAWSADGNWLVMTATEQSSNGATQQQHLWRLSYSTGEAKEITNDLNHYESVSLDGDSNVLVSVQGELSSAVWILSKGDSNKGVLVPLGGSKTDGVNGVAWMPDGRIIYTTMATGLEGIWITDQDGKNKRQVTRPEMRAAWPSVSSGGDLIFFSAAAAGRRKIWRIKTDGTEAKELTDGSGVVPQPSVDGRWIVYQSPGAGILKVPVEGGEPITLVNRGTTPALSPDGRYIAYTAGRSLLLTSIDGGEPIRSFDVPLDLPASLRWTPDSLAILFVARQNGVCDIWSQPAVGGEPKRITDLKADKIFGFDWSRDNKLLIAAGSRTSDVVLIRNVK